MTTKRIKKIKKITVTIKKIHSTAPVPYLSAVVPSQHRHVPGLQPMLHQAVEGQRKGLLVEGRALGHLNPKHLQDLRVVEALPPRLVQLSQRQIQRRQKTDLQRFERRASRSI